MNVNMELFQPKDYRTSPLALETFSMIKRLMRQRTKNAGSSRRRWGRAKPGTSRADALSSGVTWQFTSRQIKPNL